MLDWEEGRILPAEPGNQADPRYAELPKWDSSDGFRLMQSFTGDFKNPLIKEELTKALDQGKGVFRAFKDVLRRFPYAEARWRAFKKRTLKEKVIQWYNILRDDWGLERIGLEPEETGDLVLEDFTFRGPNPEDAPALQALHDRIFQEETRETVLLLMPRTVPAGVRLIAETAAGELAGCIGGISEAGAFQVNLLEVKPEFRGLGLGEELCGRLLKNLSPEEGARIAIDIPSEISGFSQVLIRQGFKPGGVRYFLENPPRD